MKHFQWLAILCVLLTGCIKEDLSPDSFFKKTTSGRNTLAFTLNGTKIYQDVTRNWLSIKKWAWLVEAHGADDVLMVQALLDNSKIPFIAFSLPKAQVEPGNGIIPEVYLYFEYLPELTHRVEYEYNGNTHTRLVIDRQTEYHKAIIKEAYVFIRFWNAKNHILSGDFTIKGEMELCDGSVTPFVINDGVFDVSNWREVDRRQDYDSRTDEQPGS